MKRLFSICTALCMIATIFVHAAEPTVPSNTYHSFVNPPKVGCPGTIITLNCGSAVNSGTLIAGQAASGVSSSVPYTGGDGGPYKDKSVSSTGVTGLTATLTAGSFANGNGSLIYNISGTPSGSGTASFALSIGGKRCTLDFTVYAVASISALNCASASLNGTLYEAISVSGVSSAIPYTGGNGGVFSSQSVSSTGVTGLTASLSAGKLDVGAGSLTYTITGIAEGSGTANFALTIGGQSCTLTRTVTASYPSGSVYCSGKPTTIVQVTSPTGKIWMDRNLGASRVATSGADASAYGDLYQWGRRADGHQCRNSGTTATLSSVDKPAHGNFITGNNADWRSPKNDNLWQGVNGVNNPCPVGFRLPTNDEYNNERLTFISQNAAGAYASVLKLTVAGFRWPGTLNNVGSRGHYWSSTVSGNSARCLSFTSNAAMYTDPRGVGFTVRCIKN